MNTRSNAVFQFLLGAVGMAFFAAALLAGTAAAADPASLRVEVYGLMGLHVLTLHSTLDEAGDRYTITTDYATRGLAGFFADLSTRASVQGRIGNPAPHPVAFRRETRHGSNERQEKVDYRPDGSIEGSSTPSPPEPVPVAAAQGTVDNLTAYFTLERQLARTGSCALVVPVYDGRYRYNLEFTDAGRKKLTAVAGQQFEGDAIACHMYRRDLPGIAQLDRQEGAREGTIWYARLLPGEAMVPVRMQMEAAIGVVDGYLAELHGRGVDLKLME
jgi:Protein of unknown function (DUF3108)